MNKDKIREIFYRHNIDETLSKERHDSTIDDLVDLFEARDKEVERLRDALKKAHSLIVKAQEADRQVYATARLMTAERVCIEAIKESKWKTT